MKHIAVAGYGCCSNSSWFLQKWSQHLLTAGCVPAVILLIQHLTDPSQVLRGWANTRLGVDLTEQAAKKSSTFIC